MGELTESERRDKFQRAFEQMNVEMAKLPEVGFSNLELRREIWKAANQHRAVIGELYPFDPLLSE